MKFGSKKYKSSAEGTSRDRLSELPDEVIVHILSFLPISDAVKTVLLRRFGSLWTMVPSLYFSFCPVLSESYDDTNYQTSLSLFSNFVRNVVVLHKRPTINKFHLEMYDEVPEIEMWTRFAVSREAKVLKVHIYSCNNKSCTLPRCIFISQSLVSLEIRGCNIEQQSRVHMGSLRKLELEEVCLSDEMLKDIISGCPSLEELVICSYTDWRLCVTSTSIKILKLEGQVRGTIDCPYLKTLQICAVDPYVEIIDVSSVSKVEIDRYGGPCKKYAPLLLSLLEKIGNAQVVNLSDSILHITISAQNLLKELSSCVMPQLKTVTMHGFGRPYRIKCQLQLVEFLLKNAVNLDKLVFVSNLEEPLEPAEELEFVKQVARVRRASSNATVVFA